MEVELQPYEWVSGDRDGGFSIRVYGHLRDQPGRPAERVLLRIEDYQPFCRLELPSFLHGKPCTWSVEALQAYAKWLRGCLRDHQPTKIVYKELQKIYGYRNQQKYPFLVCSFLTEEAMRHCVNLLNKQAYQIEQLGLIKARVWETSITTVHRLVTDLNLGYSQWLRTKVTPVLELDKISHCQHEYIASYQDIHPLSQEETQSWTVSPMTCAIDIECYSHNHLTMPNRDYVKDKVTMISYITERIGPMGGEQKKYLLVVGPCEDIPGVSVRRFGHEITMLDGLSDVINETDPTLMITYNGAGFDFPYLEARMKLYMREWKPCGLLKDQPTTIKTNSWKSSAYGFMNISTLEAEGRLNIDMYPIIKRDTKLDRYTLDFVSNHFLGQGKNDVTPKQMFEIHARAMKAEESGDQEKINEASKETAKVGAYCVQDSYLCIALLKKLNTWIGLTETSNIVSITPTAVWTRGQQVRVQNQVYRYAYREGFVMDERPGSKESFKGGQVQDPIVGKYRNVLIFDFASLYPSIIRAFNICYTTLVPPESDIPDSMCHVIQWPETDDNGVTTNYRYRFIKQEYFRGILPRMCEDLVTERKKTRAKISPTNDPVLNITLDQRQNGLKVSANSIFGSLGVMEGRMPLPEGARCVTALGRQLITIAANYVREKHNGEIVYGDTDSIMVNMNITDPHDCLRLGELLSKEITALYPRPLSLEFERAIAIGFFIMKKKYAGVPMAIIRLIEGDLIERVSFASGYENENMHLYKFTLVRNGKTEKRFVAIPNDVNLCERPLDVGCLVKVNGELAYTMGDDTFSGKKVIAGLPLAEGGAPSGKDLMKKGIILARRDNCIWAREAYEAILYSIMFDKPLSQTLELLDSYIMKMMTCQVPFKKLMITRAIGSAYKPNSTYFMKIFADELKRQGQVIVGGERVDYVFVRCSDTARNEKMGLKMRTPEMYWTNCHNEPIDRIHYVEKVLCNPCEQILYLGYKQQIDESEAKWTPQSKKRNKLYTYLSSKYIRATVKILKKKAEINAYLNTIKPHFVSQEPHFSQSFA